MQSNSKKTSEGRRRAWYARTDPNEALDEATLRQQLASGALAPDALVRRDGDTRWLPANVAMAARSSAVWRILVDGKRRGPYTRRELHAKLTDGSLSPETSAWRPGLSEWTPLRACPGLAETLPPAAIIADPQAARRAELERLIRRAPNADARHAALVELAELAHNTGDRAGAVARFRQALAARPKDERAFTGLETIYRANRAWSSLNDLYRHRAETVDGAQSARLHERLGTLSQGPLKRPKQAIEAFERALQLGGARPVSLRALVELHIEQPQIALSYLDRLLRLEINDRPALLARAVRLARRVSPEAALPRLRTLLDTQPDNLVVRTEWVDLLAQGDQPELYLTAEADLIARLPAGTRRLERRRQHAQALIRADRHPEAAEHWQAILRESPSDAEARAAVEDALAHEPTALADLRLQEALSEPDEASQVQALRTLAGWCEAEAPAAASRVWRAVVALRPRDADAQARLARLLDAAQDWQTKVEVLVDRLDRARGDARRQALYRDIADIFDRHLDEPEGAWTALMEAFAESYDDASFGADLGRLARRAGQMPALVQRYEDTLELFEAGAPVADLEARVGRWCADDLQDPVRALPHFEAALALEPSHRSGIDGLFGLAVGGNPAAAARLMPVFAASKDWSRLHTMHRLTVDTHAPGAPRAEALVALADLCFEKLHKPAEALAWLGEALRETPGAARLHTRMLALAGHLDDPALMADALAGGLAAASDPADVVRLGRTLAQVRTESGDPEGAASAWRRLLDARPEDAEALTALATHYQANDDFAALVPVLTTQLRMAPAAHRRASAERLAAAAERLASPDSQRSAWQAALLAQPDLRATRGKLIAHLTAEADWTGVYAALEPATGLGDATERAAIHAELAALCTEHLQRPVEAIDHWRAALELGGERISHLHALRPLLVSDPAAEAAVLLRLIAIDTHNAAPLQADLARLYEGPLDDTASAISAWRACLAADAAHAEAPWALHRLWTPDGPAEAHVEVLNTLLNQIADDDPQRIDLLRVRADRRVAGLNDADGAVADLEALLLIAPGDAAALSALERVQGLRDDDDALAAVLIRRANAADADEAVTLRLRIAELDAGPRGEAALRRILTDRPAHRAAFEHLAARLKAHTAWPALTDLITARLAHVAGAERLRLIDQAAGLARIQLNDPARALALLVPTLEQRADDDDLRERLAEAAESSGRWSTLIDAADALGSRALHVQAARWTAEGLHDAAGAVARLTRLLETQADAPVIDALLRLTEQGDAIVAAANVLDPVLAEQGAHARRSEVLHRRLSHEPVAAQDTTRQQLAELAVRLRRPKDAWRWRLEAFKHTPSKTNDAALVKLGSDQGRFAELAAAYEAACAATEDPEVIRRFAHSAAGLYRGRLSDLEGAERAWRLVLRRADAADRASVEGLSRLLNNAARHNELAEVLDAARSACTDETRALAWAFESGEALVAASRPGDAIGRFEAVLAEVPDHRRALAQLEALRGEVGDRAGLLAVLKARAPQRPRDTDLRVRAARLATELGQPDEAIDWWQAALDLGADEPTALAALEPLCRQAERWSEYAAVCERRRSLARDDRTIVRLDRLLGQTYTTHLNRAQEALAAWESVLRRAPEDLEALWAAHALYAQQGDPGGRAQIERRLLELIPGEDPRRAALLRGLADTYEDRLGQPEDALITWRAILAANPLDAEADAHVEALCRQLNDHAGLAERFEARAAQATDGSQVQWLLAAADLAEGPLADPERARTACRAAADLCPNDESLLDRLESLHAQCEAWADLAWLQDWRIDNGPEARRVALLIRAADLRETHLNRPSEAAGLRIRAAELYPSDAHLAEARRLAEATSAWPAFAAALEAACEAERGDALTLHRALAECYDGHLQQPSEALRHHRAVLALAPTDAVAHAAVDALLVQLEDWPTLIAWLEPTTEHDAHQRRMRCARIAEVHERRLHDQDAALALWQTVLTTDPSDDDALRQVERLSAELDDWAGLAEMTRLNAEQLTDANARAERFVRLGDLYAGPLGVPAAALAAYREALTAVPEHAGALSAFEAQCLQSGNLDQLNNWYARQMGGPIQSRPAKLASAKAASAKAPSSKASKAKATPDSKLSSTAPPQSMPVAATETPQPATAELQYTPSLPPAPASVGGVLSDADRATRALEVAYRSEGRWAELAALYRRRLPVTTESKARRALETALLDLYLGPADDPARAAALLKPRLAEDKHPRYLMQQLAELYVRAEDWPAAARMVRNHAELAVLNEAERLPLFDQLARIYRDHLNEPSLAAGWWRSSLEFDPEYAPALEGLHGLLIAQAAADEPQAPVSASAAPKVRAKAPVKRYTVNRTAAQTKRRRKLWTALALVGLVWGIVATSGLVIQSLRLDRTSDEMHTANRAYTRLAKEVTTTQERFSDVASVLNKQHGDGTPLEMFAADPVDIPDGEAAMLTDRILGIAISDLKMRQAVGAMRGLVTGMVEQREVAVAQAEELKREMDGLQVQLAKLDQAQGVADELLAQKLDGNIERLEVALDVTGLDIDGMLTPDLDAMASVGKDGAPTAVGGPFEASSTTYASPISGMTQVMSGFGWRGKEHHNGIDIPCEVGTPTRAIAEGEIIFAQSRATWDARPKFIERDGKRIKSPGWRAGVYVEIKHHDDRVSRYMHLDQLSPGIEKGSRVRKRQIIGTVGRTAVEHSRTHLHFELREAPTHPDHRWGKPVDPEAPLLTPDPAMVAQGVADLADETRRLSAMQHDPMVGAGLVGTDGPVDVSKNHTAQILGSLGVKGRIDRLHRIEKVLRYMPLVAPVEQFKISSGFGRRKDPMDGNKSGFHSGIDIPGELKTVVMVTAPGKVIYSGWKGGFGRMIEVEHSNGIVTRYGHLYKSLVRVGQHLKLREKIGLMGSTGRSTGTHLHYEVVVDGKAQNPLRFLKAGRALFNKD